MNWREQIFETVEVGGKTSVSKLYDRAMLVFIVISLIPLAFRQQNLMFAIFDWVSVTVFVIDYILRWMTADLRMPNRPRWKTFILYPITPLAIIDLLSILPVVTLLNNAFKLFRVTRLLKIVRVFKFIRYSKNVQILMRVIRKESRILLTVFWIALFYIIVTALIMFNVEESSMFDDYFDALYWATTTLTTVGYGDICPTTDIGRIISMFSAILGVAVIALPSGVITASYLDELRILKIEKNEPLTTEDKRVEEE